MDKLTSIVVLLFLLDIALLIGFVALDIDVYKKRFYHKGGE